MEHDLRSLHPELESMIIALWEPEIGIALPWTILCHYWPHFCYPGSDDISIFPLAQDWCLLYHHDDFFAYGKRT